MKFKNLFLTGLLIVNLLTPLISVSASQTSSTPPENQNTPVSKTTDTKDSKTATLPDNSSNGPFQTTVEPPIEQAADVIEADEAKPKSSNNLRATHTVGTHGSSVVTYDEDTATLTFGAGTLENNYPIYQFLEDNNFYSTVTAFNTIAYVKFAKSTIAPQNMSYFFTNIPYLLRVEFSNLDTSTVTNMSHMFSGAKELRSVAFSSTIISTNVTNMSYMFSDCSSLNTVENMNTLHAPTTMNYMFNNCSSLQKLDLNFHTVIVPAATQLNMLAGTNKLWKLTLGSNSQYDNDWGLPQVPSRNTSFTDLSTTYYVKESKWQRVSNGSDHNPLGETYNTPIHLADATPEVNAGQAETFVWSNSQYLFGVHGTAPWQLDPVSGKMVFYTGTLQTCLSVIANLNDYGLNAETLVKDISFNGTVRFPEDVTQLFFGLTSLTTFNGANVDSRFTSDWTSAFAGNEKLTSFTSGSLDTRSATSMAGLFAQCTALTTLNTSFLDTEQVTDMSYMFYGLSSLTSLTLDLNTRSATDMSYMFAESPITSLDLASFNTGQVKNMRNMFYGCQALKSINLSSFNTQNVVDFQGMFQNNVKLETLDLTPFIIRPDAAVKKMFGNTINLWQIKLGVSTVFPASPDFTEAPPAFSRIPNTTFETRWQSWQIVGNGSVHHPMGNLISTSDMWSSAFISRPVTYVWAQEPESRIDEADNLSFSTANLGSLSSFQLGLNNDVNDGITLDYLYGNYNVTVTQAEPWVGDDDVTIDASDLPITYGGQNLSSGRVTFASGNSIADRLKVKYNHDSNKSFAINLDNGSNLSTALGKTLTSTIEWSFETTP